MDGTAGKFAGGFELDGRIHPATCFASNWTSRFWTIAASPGSCFCGGRRKIKTRFGEDIRIGRFAGFDLFIRSGFNNTAELVLRGKNSYSTRVTDTALGTIRSLESEVQGFEERAARLETDIRDSQKRGVELEAKVGAPFEKEERYHHLVKRQSEIEDQLDLTKNQAPNQLEATENTEAIVEGEQPDKNETIKPKPARRVKV